MPTPKTPLPELVEINGPIIRNSAYGCFILINQIITYLKEREEAEIVFNPNSVFSHELAHGLEEVPLTYAQGYEQGRFDAEMDRLNETLPDAVTRLMKKIPLEDAQPEKPNMLVDTPLCPECPRTPNSVIHFKGHCPNHSTEKPGLKETLSEYMVTLKKEAWFRTDIKTLQSYEQALSDVEAIINRVFRDNAN